MFIKGALSLQKKMCKCKAKAIILKNEQTQVICIKGNIQVVANTNLMVMSHTQLSVYSAELNAVYILCKSGNHLMCFATYSTVAL